MVGRWLAGAIRALGEERAAVEAFASLQSSPLSPPMAPHRLVYGAAAVALWAQLAAAQPAEPTAETVLTREATAVAPTVAESDDPSSTPDALIDQGIAQRKAGDDRAALESFQRAYELGGSPRALAQLALAEQALGRWLDAHEHLTRALGQEHAWIRDHEEELRAALGDIGSELGSLEVACNVVGAEVFVDGRRLGLTPSPAAFRVVAGESVIQVVAPGYFSLTRQVQVEAGGLSRVEVTLTPRASAEAEALDSGAAARRTRAPDVAPLRAEAAPWHDALMYGSFGLAGLGVATGITGYAMREVNVKIYNDDSRCDLVPELRRSEECSEAADAWRLGENLMIGGFAAAGVFSALGVYLWLDRPDEADGAEVACMLRPSALTCSGVF